MGYFEAFWDELIPGTQLYLTDITEITDGDLPRDGRFFTLSVFSRRGDGRYLAL